MVSLFVVVAQGDASYGLLLKVGSGSPPPPTTDVIRLGEPVLLAVGQEVAIEGTSDVLAFAAVPLCPVLREDAPCPDRSFVATLVLRDATGSEVERVSSDLDGSYHIAVAPGAYVLDPQLLDGRQLPHAGPIEVTVATGAWTTLDVAYDSGIR